MKDLFSPLLPGNRNRMMKSLAAWSLRLVRSSARLGWSVDSVTLKKIEEEFDIQISREYAKGGPKGRGVSTVIFGQFIRSAGYATAHLINDCHKPDENQPKPKPNAGWGTIKVDQDFLDRYTTCDARIGENYPAVRISKDIQPGEEIFLTSYGAGYWIHQKNGNVKKVYKSRSLVPAIKRRGEDIESSDRRGKKRARKD